jgi:phosphatidylserine synthase
MWAANDPLVALANSNVHLNGVVSRTAERVSIAAIALVSTGVIVSVVTKDWDRMGTSVALITLLLASLFAQRSRSSGGRLTRVGLAVILVAAALAVALIPVGVTAADDSVQLVLSGVMYLAAGTTVVLVLVSSHRGRLGGVDRDASRR